MWGGDSGRELWAPKFPKTSKQKNLRQIQSEPGNGQFWRSVLWCKVN